MGDPATMLGVVSEAHNGQADKAGGPYIEHLLRVRDGAMRIMEALPVGNMPATEFCDVLSAALGHDLFEDTSVTPEHLRMLGFSEAVIRMIEAVTRRKDGVTYMDKIRAIAASGDLGAIVIKLADNEDNSSPERVAPLPESERGIVQRYERSKRILRAALNELVAGSGGK